MGVRQDLLHHVVHEEAGALLDALGADDERLTRRDGRRDGGQRRAQRLGGNRQNECVSAGKGVGIGCAARPQSHRMAGAARHMRQGRTPGARADDAELAAHALAPSLPAP